MRRWIVGGCAAGALLLLTGAVINPGISLRTLMYLATGTGAKARSAQSRLGDDLSALDFCNSTDVNGVTDNTTCLQNAINASQGKLLYIPAGTYIVTAPLNLTNANGGYRIICAPRIYSSASGPIGGAIIKNTSVTGTDAIYISTTNSNGAVDIQGCTVRGNALSGHGIHVSTGTVTMTDVWSLYHGLHGIYLQTAFSSMLRGCAAVQNQQDGLNITGQGNSITVTEGVYNGNDRANGGYANVRLTGTSTTQNLGVTLIGNDIEGGGIPTQTAFGLVAQYTYGLTVIGNYLEHATSDLVYIDATTDAFTFTGNFLHNGPADIAGGLNGTITNNIVESVGGSDNRNTTLTITASNGNNLRVWGNDTRIFPGSPTWTASIVFSGAVYQRKEEFGTASPVLGNYAVGDVVWNSTPSGTVAQGWTATAAGTMGTLNGGNTTGSGTSGTYTLTVNSNTGLTIGNVINIVGIAGTRTVTFISGTTITLLTTLNATVSGAAVSFSAATFAPFGYTGSVITTTDTGLTLNNNIPLNMKSTSGTAQQVLKLANNDTLQLGAAGFNTYTMSPTILQYAITNVRVVTNWAASVTIDASAGNLFEVPASSNIAHTIAAPTNRNAGQRITVKVKNTSGGALAATGWNAIYKMAAWVDPGTGFSASIDFIDDGTNLVEVSRGGTTVPN